MCIEAAGSTNVGCARVATAQVYHYMGPNSQIPQCTCPISHNAPFCNRNAHTKWRIVRYGASALWDFWDGWYGWRYGLLSYILAIHINIMRNSIDFLGVYHLKRTKQHQFSWSLGAQLATRHYTNWWWLRFNNVYLCGSKKVTLLMKLTPHLCFNDTGKSMSL